jgi:lipopolysaccharide/colanic/teichoic acid biosynthesis glycosyltransferase
MYNSLIKPLFDFFGALIALVFFSPILLMTSILMYINNDGSLIFKQIRPGKNAKLFEVIKFKTMTDKKDDSGNLLPDEQRLTPVGKFIRKTSFDELPQLFNVLKGDMSFIGPRPLLPEYLPLYSADQARRHEVKPGITGWAQINGRNAISWKQKFEFDVWYVEHQSLLLDLKILFKTIKKIVVPEGVNASNQATTTRFNGDN